VIQDLFQILAQVSNYDSAGRPSREALAQDLYVTYLSPSPTPFLPSGPILTTMYTNTRRQTLDASLLQVHRAASTLPPTQTPGIPEPLIEYVENGRNPDIYTREFVELVRRMNQLARGKMHAFGEFRDVLAREMSAAMPELAEDARRVVEATGGPMEKKVGAGGMGRDEGGGGGQGTG
jgi:mediator of RNA polymerase II transcription subunit 10